MGCDVLSLPPAWPLRRSGGLPANLAVSFSLDPRLLGHALLPDYDGVLPAGGTEMPTMLLSGRRAYVA